LKQPAGLFEPFRIIMRNAIPVVYYGVMRKRVEWIRMATGFVPLTPGPVQRNGGRSGCRGGWAGHASGRD